MNYLQSYEFRHFLQGGINPLHEMFSGRYEYIPHGDLLVIYHEKQEKYKKAIEDAFFRQMVRIRGMQFGGRERLETYQTHCDRIESKSLMGYDYVIDAREKLKKLKFSMSLLMKKIFENIWEKEQKGIDQSTVRHELYQFFQKSPNKGQLTLFNRLLAEANTELGLFILPEEFMEHKEVIYK